jgi:hypothetical protein
MTKQYIPYPKKKFKEMKYRLPPGRQEFLVSLLLLHASEMKQNARQKSVSSEDENKIPLSKDILPPLKK